MYSNKICTHIIYWILYMQQYICINIGNVAVSMYTVDVQAFRLNKTKLRYRSKNFWETAIKYVFTFFTTFFFHIHKKKEFDSRKFSATFFLMNLHALRSPEHDLTIFSFFYMHKKKVFDSLKFAISDVRWICMFWYVLNTIWPFLENVCLSAYMHVSKILYTLYLNN